MAYKSAIDKNITVHSKEELNDAMNKKYRVIHVEGSAKYDIIQAAKNKKSTNTISKIGFVTSLFIPVGFIPLLIGSLVGMGYSNNISKYNIVINGDTAYLELK